MASCKLNDVAVYNGLATESGQAIEPMVVLMETTYIGRLGPIQLVSSGVSISILNIVSKLFNISILSVATSIMVEDIAKNSSRSSSQEENSKETNGNGKTFVDVTKKKQLASVSTTLLLAVGIGIFEALGAPAVVVSLSRRLLRVHE
ncbi:hypothetical protein L6452_41910 [Arctium lappa]|uniref:Uncharacterized protein n=1 Tax=Arctium lappa TaxID=4217 RepID=A0ACB8XKV8_ARCLA|nr:hypothetical protein L6452_41910 [Arctium lappa]